MGRRHVGVKAGGTRAAASHEKGFPVDRWTVDRFTLGI
jgi:hypothetical protein